MPPLLEEASAPESRRASFEKVWLFWMALLLGGFLAVYAPIEFWRVAGAAKDANQAVTFVLMTAIGALALFSGARWCILLLLAFARVTRTQALPDAAPAQAGTAALPFVSILMPAYAEEDCIEAALGSLLALDYPAYEIVMVDDGSPDRTLDLARPFAGRHRTAHGVCDLRVLTKPNGGKWSAHNFGLKRARGELILCIDADSRLDPQSLRRLVQRMDSPRIAAVAGQIRVRNRDRLITRLQALEYVIANGTFRLAQSATGTVMVVPGPIGLFRRAVLDEVFLRFPQPLDGQHGASWSGPFSDATFAEDFHLSLAVLMLGHAIDYEPLAVSHTRSPDSIRTLINQRYRWNRGTLQVLRWFFAEARAGRVIPRLRLGLWVGLTLALDSLVLPLIQIGMVAGLIHYLLSGASLVLLGAWAACTWMLNVIAGSFFLRVHDDDLHLVVLAPLFDLYQGVMLGGAWVIAAADELRGAKMRW